MERRKFLKYQMKRVCILLILLFVFYSGFAIDPVNPLATNDVKKVLNYLSDIKGKRILTGQQNLAPDVMKWTNKVAEITGKYPALLGEDFSYGDQPGAKRLKVVEAAIGQWEQGGLVTISWHQVNPDFLSGAMGEGPFSDVQKPMEQERFNKLLCDTTEIHKKFIAHIDTIATYLKLLQDSGVVVLWRPYHEMNGDWFWWGNKTNFAALWKLMFDRYTFHHCLNNLIWVWSPNIGFPIARYYPGDRYVDIVGIDGYTGGERNWDKNPGLKEDVEKLISFSKNGIVAFAELGWLPDMDWLETQRPEFIWFLCWWTHIEKHNTEEEIIQVYNHRYSITRDEVIWRPVP